MSKIEPTTQSSRDGVVTYLTTAVNLDDSLNDWDSFGTEIDMVTVPKRKTKQYEFHEYYMGHEDQKDISVDFFILYFLFF